MQKILFKKFHHFKFDRHLNVAGSMNKSVSASNVPCMAGAQARNHIFKIFHSCK